MNKKFKDLTNKLCYELEKTSYEFFIKNLDEEEKLGDVINLALSAHLASLFSCMRNTSKPYKGITLGVEKLISNLKNSIAKSDGVKSVEN